MGWFTDDRMKKDKCVDCKEEIEIPASRGKGYSRCAEDDAIASNLQQPRAKKGGRR